MEGLLFGVTAKDRASYLTGLLALVALVASAVPALRAARSDPIVALKRRVSRGRRSDPVLDETPSGDEAATLGLQIRSENIA